MPNDWSSETIVGTDGKPSCILFDQRVIIVAYSEISIGCFGLLALLLV